MNVAQAPLDAHETAVLVPTVSGTESLSPTPIHPDEVAGFIADGWTVTWRVMTR